MILYIVYSMMTVVKKNTNNSVYQKRFGVKLSSASIIRKPPDILALPKQLKNFEKDSIFQILPHFSFLQLKTALLAYN